MVHHSHDLNISSRYDKKRQATPFSIERGNGNSAVPIFSARFARASPAGGRGSRGGLSHVVPSMQGGFDHWRLRPDRVLPGCLGAHPFQSIQAICEDIPNQAVPCPVPMRACVHLGRLHRRWPPPLPPAGHRARGGAARSGPQMAPSTSPERTPMAPRYESPSIGRSIRMVPPMMRTSEMTPSVGRCMGRHYARRLRNMGRRVCMGPCGVHLQSGAWLSTLTSPM
jgi:hypothetical protein